MKVTRLFTLVMPVLVVLMVFPGIPLQATDLGTDDDATFEVLTEWVDKDPDNTKWNLPDCHRSARRLVKKLKSIGWIVPKGFRYRRVPNWGNDQVWKSDFASSNNTQIDDVDLVFFQGHGAIRWDSVYGRYLRAIKLGRKGEVVLPGDVVKLWGDKDLEWIGLHACSVLNDASRSYWANAFNGAHLILGYATTDKHKKGGAKWGKYMIKGYTVTQAWFIMADKLQPKGVVARVLAEEKDNFKDHIWGTGKYVSPDPVVDQYYHFWDHKVGCSPPLARSTNQSSMPLYSVVLQEVTPQYVDGIAPFLGMSGEVTEEDDGFSMIDGDKYLEVSHTGAFYFVDSAHLWMPPDETPSLPDEYGAQLIAEDLLAQLRTLDVFANTSQSAVFDGVTSDLLFEGQKESDEAFNATETNRQVLYARELDGYSVVGPGARMKIYIGEGERIVGCQGGWRQVEYAGEVSIVPEDEVRRLLDTYTTRVVLGGISMYDTMDILQSTLGYYELPPDEYRFTFGSQDDVVKDVTFLIPVYIFTVEYIDEDESSIDYIHIPAAADFLPPVVDIISPSDGSEFAEGQTIELEATVLFGTPPYEYSWQTGYGEILGSDASISVAASVLISEIRLAVTDAEGREGSHVITVKVCP